VCWPSVDHIARLSSLDSGGQVTLLVWELLSKVLCNLCPSSDPDTFLAIDVFDDLLECHETTWLSNAAAMEGNGHHFWLAFTTFFVECVEGILDVIVEVCWGTEPRWDVELVVVAI
jgi:hypothetical protein